jgi:ribosome-interacting GTPase 1
MPGMLPHEDIHFQLIDLPAVSREHPLPWLASTLQTADAALIVVDLSDTACIDELQDLHALLRERRITFTERWSYEGEQLADDPFALTLPALLLVNKADLLRDADAELQALQQVSGLRYPALAISAATGHGLGAIGDWLFAHLGVVRVYTKLPGHSPDKQRPFTLRSGQTVRDVARLVHKDVERSLRYARLWGRSGFDGQQVGPDHVLDDRDVVELHT